QEFSDLRRKSDRMAERYLRGKVDSGFRVDSVKTARALLRAGIPVVLEVPVYYGAWNHRIADDLGIGRDMEAWANGEVGYPEPGSMDYEHSNDEAAGHSILIVGYDDDREVTTHVKMADGSVQTFHYRGAYIMKNSWGTEAFGRTFQADGEAYPGYGLITYKYAHEYGSFYRFPLRVSQTDN
ncbi:MAG TPA: hypothetical protein VL588_09770, partial [Bdellovibrionota bacterium]|nr:hypothetical protein [Bdellovibrionota bacterium]